MDKDWKDNITFHDGRYGKFHIPTRKWHLFDRNGNSMTSARNLRELEEKNRNI
jgi:hypothetical protein